MSLFSDSKIPKTCFGYALLISLLTHILTARNTEKLFQAKKRLMFHTLLNPLEKLINSVDHIFGYIQMQQ